MAEPQLSVCSALAHDIAHRLARRENRSVAEVVETALERYEQSEAKREPAADFYARLKAEYATDIDLDAILQENRRPSRDVDL